MCAKATVLQLSPVATVYVSVVHVGAYTELLVVDTALEVAVAAPVPFSAYGT